jgi:hypothetical protein
MDCSLAIGCAQAHTSLTPVCCARHTSVTQHSLHMYAVTLTYKRVCVSAVHRRLGYDGTHARAHTLLQVPRCTKDLSGSVVVRCVRQSRWHITLLSHTSRHTRSPCVSHSQPVSSAVIVITDVQRTPSHDTPTACTMTMFVQARVWMQPLSTTDLRRTAPLASLVSTPTAS